MKKYKNALLLVIAGSFGIGIDAQNGPDFRVVIWDTVVKPQSFFFDPVISRFDLEKPEIVAELQNSESSRFEVRTYTCYKDMYSRATALFDTLGRTTIQDTLINSLPGLGLCQLDAGRKNFLIMQLVVGTVRNKTLSSLSAEDSLDIKNICENVQMHLMLKETENSAAFTKDLDACVGDYNQKAFKLYEKYIQEPLETKELSDIQTGINKLLPGRSLEEEMFRNRLEALADSRQKAIGDELSSHMHELTLHD